MKRKTTILAKVILIALLIWPFAGCDLLESPTGQFILNEAAKQTASFIDKGGSVDNAWGVMAGLSTVADAWTFYKAQRDQQKAPAQVVADTTKASVNDSTAINTLANGLGLLVSGSLTSREAAERTKLVVHGVSKAASSATP